MDWKDAYRRYKNLAILVVDIRSSTEVFATAPDESVFTFINEFASMTQGAIESLGIPGDEWDINNFGGDGFLILFEEPDRDDPNAAERSGRVASMRALTAARNMRRSFRDLCTHGDPQYAADGFNALTLVGGICYGQVLYANPTGVILPRPTAITRNVTLAFRLAQAADENHILMCEDAYRSLPTGHGLSFARLDSEIHPKGFRNPVTCYDLGPEWA